MSLIPPKRNQKLLTKAGSPTSRTAEFFERIADTVNNSSDVFGLGTAAVEDVGVQPGNVVQLNASGGLPAVDGSQLTGIVGLEGPQGPPGLDGAGASPPETLTFTYNPDGTVLGIDGATTDLDFTYSSGLVSTIDDQTNLKTFAYNGSNQLISITVS